MNASPWNFAGDYLTACGLSQGGEAGQAKRIVEGTGGIDAEVDDASAVVAKIFRDWDIVVPPAFAGADISCDEGISITFDPEMPLTGPEA